MLDVHITVDTEVWPVVGGGWPRNPLDANYDCKRELSAYFVGKTREGDFGLPYQLETLRTNGLGATYFVDPFFSFALGLDPLADVVGSIEGAGQSVALHLHPEWLTDPRCVGLPAFRGPYLSQYGPEDQRLLIRAGMRRLVEAGARPLPVFRAGSWGADVSTLLALRDEGILVDSSLNAAHADSLSSLAPRSELHDPSFQHGVAEFPLTRFDDRISAFGRPLSPVGTSWAEMRFVLDACHAARRRSVVLVLHSNEFVKTEMLWKGKQPTPRRLVVRRFEKLCRYLAGNRDRFRCVPLPAAADCPVDNRANDAMPRSNLIRTGLRVLGQAASRWY